MIWGLLRDKDNCDGPKFCNDHPFQHEDDCPAYLIQDLMRSGNGYLLQRALQLEFASSKHFTLNLDEIPADEFLTMQLLESERNRYERERLEREKQERQMGPILPPKPK